MRIYNIDGPDGTGKSTLVDNLLNYFMSRGKRVGFIHFPRYNTDIGTLIREALFIRTAMDPKSMQMLYSIDRLNFTKFDLPILEKQLDILLVDRYITSGIVYGQADGVAPEDILCFDKETKKADLNIILLAKPEITMKRMLIKEKDKYENFSTQKKVFEFYKTIHTFFPETIYINAEKSSIQVFRNVVSKLEEREIL